MEGITETDRRDHPGQRKRKKCPGCCYLLHWLLLLVSLAVCILSGIEFHRQRQVDLTAGTKTDEICMSCDLLDCSNPGNGLTLRQDGTEAKLCADRVSQMPALLEQIMQGADTATSAHRRVIPPKWAPPPRLLLYERKVFEWIASGGGIYHSYISPGLPVSQDDSPGKNNKCFGLTSYTLPHTKITATFNENGSYFALKHQKEMKSWSEHTRNINVSRSGMTVLIPGRYRVYSSLGFKPNSARSCKHFAKQTWEHVVILTRSSADGDEERRAILTNSHTCCNDCIYNRATSFSEGIFDLQTGDHLHVEVSGEGIVSFTAQGSFLGMFMFQA